MPKSLVFLVLILSYAEQRGSHLVLGQILVSKLAVGCFLTHKRTTVFKKEVCPTPISQQGWGSKDPKLRVLLSTRWPSAKQRIMSALFPAQYQFCMRSP